MYLIGARFVSDGLQVCDGLLTVPTVFPIPFDIRLPELRHCRDDPPLSRWFVQKVIIIAVSLRNAWHNIKYLIY